ncbi:MAG: D-alanyl-D-alanine carboxypeptidase/D-alanyl-D-alanine-endopeptidase [Gordonia sp. (in: high G+C Gram-positive bacteria)]
MGTATRPRRRGRAIVRSLLTVVLVAGIAAGGVVTYRQLADREELPPGFPARPAAIAVAPLIRAVSPTARQPTAAGVTRAVAASLRDPALGTLTGQVSDALTGQVLWSRGPDRPRTPASNAKILTASAVLLALPHDKRLTTTAYLDDDTVILKGAGDPTLTAQPTDADTFYTDPARLTDLAAQIRRSGVRVRAVAVDLSAYNGPTMDDSWDDADIAGGDITPIESLIVDGGRSDDPLDEFSPRVEKPGLAAGRALAALLDVAGEVTEETAPTDAREIATVTSAPLVTRVNDMMRFSDNVLAETLSVELSTATGGPATLDGGAKAVRKVLADKGFDVSSVTLEDASGLSQDDRVPARLLDALMGAASGPTADAATAERDTLLRPMLDGLPIAAGTGTLAERFDPETNPGAGWVRAKTGTLTGVSSLTGIVQTVDGRVLSFALMSGGTSPADARPALDAIAGDLRECGCS